MTDKNISIWEVEKFLIDNLKEIPMRAGKFKIKAEYYLQEFLEKVRNLYKRKLVMKLIDKDALVTEIERRIKTNKECMLGLRNLDYYQGKVDALNDTISFINTLEVKEVDLDAEVEDYIENTSFVTYDLEDCDIKMTAKHFFELGLKAQKGEEV